MEGLRHLAVSAEVVFQHVQYATRHVRRRRRCDVLGQRDLHALAGGVEPNLIALGARLDVVLAAAEQPREEPGLVIGILDTFGQVHVVDALAAVEIVDANVTCRQRPADTGPGTIEVGVQLQNRSAARRIEQADTARRIEVTFGQQRHRIALLHAPSKTGLQFVEQHAIELLVYRALRPGNLGGAPRWPLHAHQVDFTGVALHAWLYTNPHSGFITLQAELS